jgi:hypothetical protein
MVKAGYLVFMVLAGCSASGVGDSSSTGPDGGAAEVAPMPRTDAGLPPSDGAPAPDAKEAPDGLPAGGDSGPALGCGDIMPIPGLAPFEAIKRLATTSQEVRILVYGQSDDEQPWWTLVRDWIKAQYPRGNLVMEEHARGACSSPCLIGRGPWVVDRLTENRVPDDVFAWRPDLMLFSVFGRQDDYETLVDGFKNGCVAFDSHPSPTAHCKANARFPGYVAPELLLHSYYRYEDIVYNGPPPIPPPLNDAARFDWWMATFWMPSVAKKFGAVFEPTWEHWTDYLQTNHIKAMDLLPDGENLTDAGNNLMARLIERYLCYVPPR